MLLLTVEERDGWLMSAWSGTYKVGWEQLLRAIHLAYPYYVNPSVLTSDTSGTTGTVVEVKNAEEILSLPESASITIRGISKIFKCPVSVTFVNQSNIVYLNIPTSQREEFTKADYEQFNKSCTDYITSMELAMYRN